MRKAVSYTCRFCCEPRVFRIKTFIRRQLWTKICYQQICQAILKLKNYTRKKQHVAGTVCIILLRLSLTEMKIYSTIKAVEWHKNVPFYASHPNLPEGASDCGLPEISLFIQCLSESGLKVFENTKDRIKVVEGEAIAGCCGKQWPIMMHIMALSTVIGRPIFSLYPECNTNTRALCHKEILPRDYDTKKRDFSANTAMILWSRDSNLDHRHTLYIHFIDAP